MSSKSSSSQTSIFKRKIYTPAIIPLKKLKCERQIDLSEDEIIRCRLLFEGDQGSDDRRILTLIKTLNTSINHSSLLDIEKIFSLLHSIEHSHRILQMTLQMDEREQRFYTMKSEHLHQQMQQLREDLKRNEQRLFEVKQRRSHLQQYDQRTEIINQLSTRTELRMQQASILERQRYFEHLQQTFENTYHQRLKQIAIYMQPIFELNQILQQDIHEDALNESTIDLLPSMINNERSRTYSDSSITSIDGDENNLKTHLGINTFPSSLENNQVQPLFANTFELYGTHLVDPLVIRSTSDID